MVFFFGLAKNMSFRRAKRTIFTSEGCNININYYKYLILEQNFYIINLNTSKMKKKRN